MMGHLSRPTSSKGKDTASEPASSTSKRRDSLLQSGRKPDIGAGNLSGGSSNAVTSSVLLNDSWIPCGICRKVFSACRPEALLAHLGGHFEQRYTYHRCQQCQINFVCEADLRAHLLSASRHKLCGFMFEHVQPCTGHHPPKWRRTWSSKDDDRFDFCYRVRHWEQSQIRASTQLRPQVQEGTVHAKRPFSIGSLTSLIRLPIFNHSKGSDIASKITDQKSSDASISMLTDVLGAALLRAVCTGNAELVRSFMCAGANMHFVDAFGFGALHYVAQYGTPEVAWLIVRQGADVNIPDRHGRTPLFHAVRTGKSVLVHYFIAWGAQVQIEDLLISVEYGNTEDAEILVEEWIHAGKPIDAFDALLLQAVKQSDKNMAELLLENGARSFATDSYGRTALSIAISAEDREIVLLLIEYGAEPDGWNAQNDKSLADAVKYRHLAMVELLLSKSA